MALPLSDTALRKLRQSKIEPQVILEIDGFPQTFGVHAVKTIPKIGQTGLVIGGFIIGGLVDLPGQKAIISPGKTRLSLDQQMEPDKGGVQSVSRLNIFLIDNQAELVELFRPGNNVPDMISRNARVYVGFKDTAHPEDSTLVLSGVIDEIRFPPGGCVLSIAHPEQLKRTDLFKAAVTKLSSAISDSSSNVPLIDASNHIEPSGRVVSYVRINDEIMSFASVSGNNLVGAVRGLQGTTAAAHAQDDTVEALYTVTGDAINASLELLLSGGVEFFGENQDVTNILQITPSLDVPNSVFFKGINIQSLYNLVVGDIAVISGSGFAANNESRTISSFVEVATGTYMVLAGGSTMVKEAGTSAVIKFKSKYNVLNIGVGLTPLLVDVPEFERIFATFNADFPDLEVPVFGDIEAKKLIDEKILFPSGVYPVPRKGKVSVSKVTKPLLDFGSIVLDETNIVRPDRLEIRRSMNKHFYNKVKFFYAQNFLDDGKYKATKEETSARSKERIPIKDKTLRIFAGGLRDNNETLNLINRLFTQFLDRYQFGAEHLNKVRVLYRDGLQVEVADTVLFNPSALLVADPTRGTRSFVTRLMLVTNVNKSIEGIIELDLLDTAFELRGRYGVISPASKIQAGSTVSALNVIDVFDELSSDIQRNKWERWIGEKVLVRSEDFTNQEEVTLKGFNEANGNEMLIEPVLGFAPPLNGIVEVPNYPAGTDPSENMLYKAAYCFMMPQVSITAGVSNTEFTVGTGDIGKFKIGSIIKVHNLTFTVSAEETTIANIVGNNIITDDDLGFTPSVNEVVDLIGFNDEGEPYRVL